MKIKIYFAPIMYVWNKILLTIIVFKEGFAKQKYLIFSQYKLLFQFPFPY